MRFIIILTFSDVRPEHLFTIAQQVIEIEAENRYVAVSQVMLSHDVQIPAHLVLQRVEIDNAEAGESMAEKVLKWLE